MTVDTDYRPLADDQIRTLTENGCTADDWSSVKVAPGFHPSRVRDAHFSGQVRLGANDGVIAAAAGIEKSCGIYRAHLHNCTVGDEVREAGSGEVVWAATGVPHGVANQGKERLVIVVIIAPPPK